MHYPCFQFIFSTAGVEYVAASVEVQFQMAPDTLCHSFTILEDTEVEPVETFGVLLETSDPAVRVTHTFATVSINDSTGISTVLAVLLSIWLLTDTPRIVSTLMMMTVIYCSDPSWI